MKITKKQLDRLVEGLVKEQWADWELGLGEKPDEQDEKFPFPNDDSDDDLQEQFEWTDEELASMGEEEDEAEADDWFSNFTGELTGVEDEDEKAWNDEMAHMQKKHGWSDQPKRIGSSDTPPWSEFESDEDEDNQPWDDEYVGKADRAERHVQEAKKKKKHKSPAEKVRKPTAPPSRQHKDPTRYDRKRDKKVPLDEVTPRGSMMRGKGENVASTLVNKVMADLRRILGQKASWVDVHSWEQLEQALTQVARQAYSELDELDLD